MQPHRIMMRVLVLGSAAFLARGVAEAQNYWQHISPFAGDWFDPTNWSDGVPTSFDWAVINNSGHAQINGGTAFADWLWVGYDEGVFDNTGTLSQTGGELRIGWEGVEEVEEGRGGHLRIGIGTTGTARQSDGAIAITETLQIEQGTYYLSGGELHLTGTWVLEEDPNWPDWWYFEQAYARIESQGALVQTGGTFFTTPHGARGGITVVGTYELRDGNLLNSPDGGGKLSVVGSIGGFTQTGGMNGVSELVVDGSYTLAGGELFPNWEYVFGTFLQETGIHQTLRLEIDRGGTYTIIAGILTASDVRLGPYYGHGTLAIASSEALISVSEQSAGAGARFCFYAGAVFTSVPGSAILMTDAELENESTDPVALVGLSNLELIFGDLDGQYDHLEVSGEDMGRTLAGFQDNFSLGALSVGDEVQLGLAQLVDEFDNQPDWAGDEALYVESLAVGPNSCLDLNGLNLYYLNLDDLGGTILLNGGQLLQVVSGDLDGDGDVDLADLATLLAAYGACEGDPVFDPAADLDGSGCVDLSDLAELLAHYGVGT